MEEYYLKTPLKQADIERLKIGDIVYLENILYTARDRAHKYLQDNYNNEELCPENLEGAAIFHAGPIVKKKENGEYSIGAIGPTTSLRMESYSSFMGKIGVKAIIGKGGMGRGTSIAMKKHKMVYLVAAHGCAVIHSNNIESIEKEYWMKDFGMPEAMWVLKCKNFGPLVVGIDSSGRNVFEEIAKSSKETINKTYKDIC